MILDMGNAEDTPLILGRPFLNTTNACIYVASGQIQFHFAGRKEIFDFASGQPLFNEKQEKKKHPKRIKMKKPKLIEEPEKPVKKKNRKRWNKKKDPSLNLSSSYPDKASEVEQEEMPPLKDEWPWAQQKGKFSIPCIYLLHFISCISFSINLFTLHDRLVAFKLLYVNK